MDSVTPPSAPAPTVGVVGAGIAGLTTAWLLREAGIAVTVYEASARVGGVMVSTRDGDWLAEGGPNTILETDPRIAALIGRLNLGSRRQYSLPEATARYVVRGAQPRPLPGSALQFLGCDLFSGSAKLRLAAEPFIGRGSGQESVADFVRRRLGPEFLEYAIDPLVTGIYAGDPAALSMRHAFPRIQALEDRYGSLIRGQFLGARERRRRGDVSKDRARKFSFDDGLQVLPDTLAAQLGPAVRRSTPVTSLGRTATGWELGLGGNGGDVAHHDAVLVATTARAVARLEWKVPGLPALQSLDTLPYPPVSSVVLGYRREDVRHPCSGFGVLIPHREGFGILGTLFSSSLFPRRAPAGHVTLTTYVGGARNGALALLPDGELVDLVRRDLGRLLGADGTPVWRHITRWPHAIPQYNLGHGRFQELLDQAEAAAPGLFFGGNFRAGVALSDALLEAGRLAERIQARLRVPVS